MLSFLSKFFKIRYSSTCSYSIHFTRIFETNSVTPINIFVSHFWHLYNHSCIQHERVKQSTYQGQVVQKPVNTNSGLKVDQSIMKFFCNIFFFRLLMFCAVWSYSSSKLRGKTINLSRKPHRKVKKLENKFLLIVG